MGTIKVPVLLVVSLAKGSSPADAHTKAASCLILTYVHFVCLWFPLWAAFEG